MSSFDDQLRRDFREAAPVADRPAGDILADLQPAMGRAHRRRVATIAVFGLLVAIAVGVSGFRLLTDTVTTERIDVDGGELVPAGQDDGVPKAPTPTPSPIPTERHSPTPTATPEPTPTAGAGPTATPTVTPTAQPTPTASAAVEPDDEPGLGPAVPATPPPVQPESTATPQPLPATPPPAGPTVPATTPATPEPPASPISSPEPTPTTVPQPEPTPEATPEPPTPEPPATTTGTYGAGAAGSVTISRTGGTLTVVSVKTNPGWAHEIRQNDSAEVKVLFFHRSGGEIDDEVEFEAKIEDTGIQIEVS